MHAAVQVTDLEELQNQTMLEVSGWSGTYGLVRSWLVKSINCNVLVYNTIQLYMNNEMSIILFFNYYFC